MLIKNCTVLTLDPPSFEKADLRIEKGMITAKKKTLTPLRNEEIVDLEGKYVMPGLVNAHTHLYSSLSRGMPAPKKSPANFLEVLQYVWWRLDRALDEESIYYSALAGSIEAALCGTTTLIDHHASPNAIAGSLDLIKQGMEEIGLRGVLCYEVTDRGGMKKRDAGLKENERFIRTHRDHPLYRGLIGAHASFTLSNDSLRLIDEMAKRTQSGVHIHVAEDKADVTDAEENYRCGILKRLEQFHLLTESSILAHGVHLSASEIRTVAQYKSWLIHNPRSNMNNSVGYAPVPLFGRYTALGTDGFPADMFEEARAGFFKQQDAHSEAHVKQQNASMLSLLQGGQNLTGKLFGKQFGTLSAGSVADLTVLDYLPPTPLTKENLAGHALFGLRSAMVDSVMVNGKWIVWNRQMPGIDIQSVKEKAAVAAKKLWKKMERL